MKCISNGAKVTKFKELEAYEYEYFGIAWTPIEDDRMAYVLVGTNDAEAGNKTPLYDADLINYTGSLLFLDTTYYFKNGKIHGNEVGSPAYVSGGKEVFATDGLFDGPSAENQARTMLNIFSKQATE